MATFNLKSVLRGYRRLFGMTAEIYNENGDLLDSVDLNNSRKKVSFRFDKDEALQGANNADLTIKLIDNNGDELNLTRNGGRQYDLDTDQQTFTTTISARKRRGRTKLDPSSRKIDNAAPLFTSDTVSSVEENVAPGTLVYDAETTDASSVSYALNGGDSAAFSIDPQTGQVTINQSPDFESKSSYSFNVVATDASGNSSSQQVSIGVNNVKDTGDTINLTPFQDIYDENTGTTINGGTQTTRNERTSIFDEIIEGTAGELNAGDSITDPSTSDADALNIATANGANNLETAVAVINNLTNVEALAATGSNDDSNFVSFENITGLKEFKFKGSHVDQFVIQNLETARTTSYDFSEAFNPVNTLGFVVDVHNEVDTKITESTSFLGSSANDVFVASLGSTIALMGDGDDTALGSVANASYMEGGLGQDVITLFTDNAATDTVSLKGIDDENNRTIINTGFVHFNDPVNNPSGNVADLIEFDADTVTNFTAGSTIQQRNRAFLENLAASGNPASAQNIMLVDSAAEIAATNLSAVGESWVAFANDTGSILYSQNGNFANNAEEIGQINDSDPAFFFSEKNVVVV